jgi:phosphopantothenoylcysteine synthetase/decarboxylase
MPATANIIGKLAHGICDDLISTSAISAQIPLGIIPNMNSDMWFSKANQKNVTLIKELGYHILEPQIGNNDDDSLIDLYHKNEKEVPISSITYEEIVKFAKEIIKK